MWRILIRRRRAALRRSHCWRSSPAGCRTRRLDLAERRGRSGISSRRGLRAWPRCAVRCGRNGFRWAHPRRPRPATRAPAGWQTPRRRSAAWSPGNRVRSHPRPWPEAIARPQADPRRRPDATGFGQTGFADSHPRPWPRAVGRPPSPDWQLPRKAASCRRCWWNWPSLACPGFSPPQPRRPAPPPAKPWHPPRRFDWHRSQPRPLPRR